MKLQCTCEIIEIEFPANSWMLTRCTCTFVELFYIENRTIINYFDVTPSISVYTIKTDCSALDLKQAYVFLELKQLTANEQN